MRHHFGCRKLKKYYFYYMFVRKKKNRSGSTSIVVVNKVLGRVNYIKTIGISSDEQEIERLFRLGQEYINNWGGQKDIFINYDQQLNEEYLTNHFISNIENVLLNGTQLILNRVYKRIGFDKIDDQILKHLAVARLSQPMSKAATVDYLKSHFEEDVNLSKIYRYLDKLYNTQQDNIQKISIEHTRKILVERLDCCFMM